MEIPMDPMKHACDRKTYGPAQVLLTLGKTNKTVTVSSESHDPIFLVWSWSQEAGLGHLGQSDRQGLDLLVTHQMSEDAVMANRRPRR